jgi:uncharacterized protein (DUF2062 family)
MKDVSILRRGEEMRAMLRPISIEAFRFDAMKRNAALWLCQGVSPRRLAITLALGFAIGCIPVIGIPTVLCAALAFGLRLNLPAIQAANYAAMPFQLALILPFVRLGGWIFSPSASRNLSSAAHTTLSATALFHLSGSGLMLQMGALTGHALVAWLLLAAPAVALMTAPLTIMLRRIPALAAPAAQAGD